MSQVISLDITLAVTLSLAIPFTLVFLRFRKILKCTSWSIQFVATNKNDKERV